MYLFLDTETTGLDEEDRLIQLAYIDEKNNIVDKLFCPDIPIKIAAMAIHNITTKMVFHKKKFNESREKYNLIQLLKNGTIPVIHNAKFDIGMLEKEGVDVTRFICTQKLIYFLDINGIIESYSLQYLRYWFGLGVEATAHDALGDVLVLKELFKKIIEPKLSLEQMIKISSNPTLISKINFGKHKGELFKNIPYDYLKWIQSQPSMGEDLLYTAKYWMEKGEKK